MNAGSLSRSPAAQSSSANSRIRQRSPFRPVGADHRIHSMRATGASGGGGGIYAARSLHSGAGWPVRRIMGRSEEAFQHSDAAGRSTNWCSGARHAGPPGAHGRISTVSSGACMRNDSMRIRPDQIRFDQVRFDSAKFGHRVSLGNKAVVVWTTNATRRLALNGGSSATRTASRIQAASAKSTANYVAAPEDRESGGGGGGGGASARSSTGHASVTSGEEEDRPHLQASAAAVADKPSESSVVVVMEKKRSREKSSVVFISNSDSMVRFHPSPGNLRLIDPAPARVRASSTTVPTDAGHGLLAPLQVYGRVCRNEAASKGTQEAAGGSFRQICSSASYTVVLDRLQRERASERHAESRVAAVSRKSHESLSSNSKPVIATNASEAVNLKSEKVASNHRNVSRKVKSSTGNKEGSTFCVDDVATELKRKTSEPERAREAATADRKRSVKYDVGESLEDIAIACEPCSSSASSHSPRERTEFQKEKTVTDFMDEEAANESGAAMKVRFTKSVNVNETLAVDHFRQRLEEERTRTTTLRRKLGVIRKDLTKSRTELIREEELRARSEQWAEYLERELELYVRSRAEAEKRYLNLLQVVRGIDRFTKQLLHKYVALHRKVEVGFEKLATSLPQQILPIPKPHDSPPPPAATAASAPVRDQKDDRSTEMRAADVASETRDEGPPPSTEDDIQLDLLPDDDYDFITKYLRASASLPEAIADVDIAGLYPEADECDTEANWSSNNFVSFCGEASRSFDETGRRDEQCRNVRLLKSEDVVAANDGWSREGAGAKKKRSKAYDVRLKRLGRFFDRVVRICRQKPEANFRLLADKSCLLADEIRLSIDERKRRDTRSKRRRQGPWQNGGFLTKDFVFQVRSHGAGDITEEAHFDMENVSRCHEHLPSDLEDEVDWEDDEEEEDEEEEEDTEEEEEVEDIFEEEEELLVDVIGVKKQNANKRHEKKLEEKKREEKTREEKKREDKELEEKQREYKRLEEQKREEKRLEEQKRETKKLLEKTREEKTPEEQKRVEKKLEESRREHKRIEEQEREEKKLEEKTHEEKRLEEQKRVEKKLEEKKREEEMLEKQKLEEKKLENKRREERKLEEQKRVERKLEEQKREEERLERQRREKLEEKKLDDLYREEKRLREQRREERKQEEKKREEQNREGKKREEKHDGSKPKSTSSNQCDAALSTPTTAKKSPPNHKEENDRQSGTETKSKGRPGGAEDREGVAIPSSVQQAYIRRLLTEMCHYCDRYRPGDSTDGLKVFLRDTIEADFLQSTDAGASHSRNVDQ